MNFSPGGTPVTPTPGYSRLAVDQSGALSLVQIPHDTVLSLVQIPHDTVLSLGEPYYVAAKSMP